MPISVAKDRQGRTRYEYEFSRIINGERFRTRKRLPAAWTRTQADAYERKRSAEIYAQIAGIETRRWLISEAVACYLSGRAVDLKAGRGTAREIRNMEPYWHSRSLPELHEVCAAFTRDHRMKLAPATIMNRLRYLIGACRWAWRHAKMGETDPGAGIPMPAVNNKSKVYGTREQMVRIARACPHKPTRAAIRIAYYSGMRLGEIERAGRTLGSFVLADSKNGEPRIIPMHPKVRCCAFIPQGSRYQTHYHFTKAKKAAGIRTKLTFHSFRHGAATAMISAGVPLYTVGAVLGHKSQQSTQRYAHHVQDVVREAVERIGRPTSSPSSPRATGPVPAIPPMEARAGVEPTYSDLQSQKRA